MTRDPASLKPDTWRIATAGAIPTLVGLAALAEGYPLPARVSTVAVVLVGGLVLSGTGWFVQWCRDRDLIVAPGVVGLGLLGGVIWAFLTPGVTGAVVGDAVVVAGEPVLARIVGTSPLLLVVGGCFALVEPTVRDTAEGFRSERGSPGVRRSTALARGGIGGAVLTGLSVMSGVLLGDALTSVPLLGFAVAGGIGSGTVIGYLWTRHRLRGPLIALLSITAAAVIGITAGGSPRGFPLAWPVWLSLGLTLGGLEATVRWLRGL